MAKPARRIRPLLTALMLLVALWAGGFFYFLASIPHQVQAADEKTDAIVALTGGSSRMSEGILLLRQGLAKKLFISGVNREVKLGELLASNGFNPKEAREMESRVVFGFDAVDTRSNAREVMNWLLKEKATSVRLVTSNYHMPRSVYELRVLAKKELPELKIVRHPVFPNHVRLANWWEFPGTAWLLFSEYNKLLFASLRHASLQRQSL